MLISALASANIKNQKLRGKIMSSKELAILDNTQENIMKLWGDEKNLKEIKSLYAPKATDLEFRAF